MTLEIRVPEAGESITQVELARWLVEDGSYIEKDQEIAEIDSDKATLTINAEAAGIIKTIVEEGTTTEPGKIIGYIDTKAQRPKEPESESLLAEPKQSETRPGDADSPGEKPGSGKAANTTSDDQNNTEAKETQSNVVISPQAKKLLEENNLPVNWDHIHPESRRITKKDILVAISSNFPGKSSIDSEAYSTANDTTYRTGKRGENKQKMSTLRKKVAERLVAIKNQTAMLTTFNEVDMSAILKIRKKHQHAFIEKYGIKMGFMSFFVKAVTESIPFYPQVNGYIDGQYIVIPDYADVGIAVSTPKGLMVPVIRNADSLDIPQLEEYINTLAEKARSNKITIEELTGGTISITNGGVFGSMLSTPIINPPQSAILGMHNIIERPVAVNGKVEIRPMMYLALSYDHRIIDGKESVSFLVKVKEMIENPVQLLLAGKKPEETLLGL